MTMFPEYMIGLDIHYYYALKSFREIMVILENLVKLDLMAPRLVRIS